MPLLLDLLQRNQPSSIATGAMFRSLLPGMRAGKVRIPKRPRPALARPRFVDLASTAFAVEENAVTVRKFDQTLADSHPPHVSLFELGGIQFQQCSADLDFLFVDPDMARRPSATIAALRALES